MQVTSGLYKNIAEWSGCMRQILKERTTDVKHQVDECDIHEIEPVVTFDQPLWLKQMMIKRKENLPITTLLGNFHTRMSYLGYEKFWNIGIIFNYIC